MSGSVFVAFAPLVLLLAAFEVWCLIDINKRQVKHLPRWAWVIISIVSVPTGGIVYLVIGRGDRAG